MEKELSFEQAMEKLEQIVRQLEDGNVPLEQSIALFQEGMQLSQFCTQKLDQFETKIEMLIEQEGTLQKKPFHAAPPDKEEQD